MTGKIIVLQKDKRKKHREIKVQLKRHIKVKKLINQFKGTNIEIKRNKIKATKIKLYDLLEDNNIDWEIGGYKGLSILTLYLLSTKQISLNIPKANKTYKNNIDYILDNLEIDI